MVRIIAGEFKSRRLVSPRAAAVRPTSDRVKESLFGILGPRLDGARVLDLYAGTGNLGLEALSRGAATCCFVERAPSPCAAIRKNTAALGIEGRAEVLRLDCVRALGHLAQRGDRFSLVFADPPYAKKEESGSEFKKILLGLDVCASLAPGALVAAEHCKFDAPPVGLVNLRLLDQRRYGDTVISFFSAP
ncbi:MAG: 16S rRNA (guanine(966)-N(2))-methyltransferase RsmD [Chlamydiota bacterium]